MNVMTYNKITRITSEEAVYQHCGNEYCSNGCHIRPVGRFPVSSMVARISTLPGPTFR